MGFLKNLLSDGYGNGQQYIDNTSQAVATRLDYLRYAPYADWNGNRFPSEPLPKDVCTQPREITFCATGMDYTAMLRVEDTYHYPYNYHQIKELLNSPEYYDDKNASTLGGLMLRVSRRTSGLFDLYPREGAAHVLIPMTHEPVGDVLKLPSPIQELLSGKQGFSERSAMRSLLNQALRDDSWQYAAFRYVDPPISNLFGMEELEPEYVIFLHVDIDVRINGIKADKYNLTHTERAEIARTLHTGQPSGKFLSDGKELADDIPEEIFNKYDARRAESLDFNRWYGVRQTDAVRQKYRAATR